MRHRASLLFYRLAGRAYRSGWLWAALRLTSLGDWLAPEVPEPPPVRRLDVGTLRAGTLVVWWAGEGYEVGAQAQRMLGRREGRA